MKRTEIMDIEKAEYSNKLSELKKELVKLNAQASTGTAMKNPGMIKKTKKNIARILTLINKNKEVKTKKA